MSSHKSQQCIVKLTVTGAQPIKCSPAQHLKLQVFTGFSRVGPRIAVNERADSETVARLEQEIEQFASI